MSSKKQLTLFGGFARKKYKYFVYANPQNDYENYVERYCLRNGGKTKQKVVEDAQSSWNDVKTDKEAISLLYEREKNLS